MPTPLERRLKQNFITRPLGRAVQINRLARKRRIMRPEKYRVADPVLTQGGKSALKAYSRQRKNIQKIMVKMSKDAIVDRAKSRGK